MTSLLFIPFDWSGLSVIKITHQNAYSSKMYCPGKVLKSSERPKWRREGSTSCACSHCDLKYIICHFCIMTSPYSFETIMEQEGQNDNVYYKYELKQVHYSPYRTPSPTYIVTLIICYSTPSRHGSGLCEEGVPGRGCSEAAHSACGGGLAAGSFCTSSGSSCPAWGGWTSTRSMMPKSCASTGLM